MRLFHVKKGFPKGFKSNVGKVGLKFTAHAKAAATNDRYGIISLPESVDTNSATCFEVAIKDGQVCKLAYRLPYDRDKDLTLVVAPVGNFFIVLTVWLNLRTDEHKTLDLSRYENAD